MRIFTLGLLVVVAGLSAGCSRFGVGQPRAMIYQNTITPLTMKRPAFGAPGVEIPENLREHRLSAQYLEANAPIIGPPWLRAISAGWGDISTQRTLEEGDFEEVVYADAHVVSILGIYERSTVIAWGVPRESDALEAGEQSPTPSTNTRENQP